MKTLTTLLALFLLFGCSSRMPYESTLDLQIQADTGNLYPSVTASIHGKDLRSRPEIVFYNFGSAPASLASDTPIHELLTARLVAAYREQGLKLAVDAPVTLTLEIQKLHAMVSRQNALYRTDALCSLRFIVNNRGASLTKDYNRQADQKSLMRPDLDDVEAMLESQVSEVLELILNDATVRSFIRKEAENNG